MFSVSAVAQLDGVWGRILEDGSVTDFDYLWRPNVLFGPVIFLWPE